jgi:L-2-hydroxyglutarate oxidase LhgO
VQIVVVGGGILGVAAARLLAREHGGDGVLLLEKEPELARHQTGHNSGVVHAGLYYRPGSLKARLCRRGGELLRTFCAEQSIAVAACGKVVLAHDASELERLRRLEERASANEVPGLRWLDQAALHDIEPHVAGIAALHSPSSALVDFGAVTDALAAQLRSLGGEIRTTSEVTAIHPSAAGATVELRGGERLQADRVLVCAGLQADRLARASGGAADPRIVPFRGEYWKLRPERGDLVRGLIYSVPDPSLPFLGVHFGRRTNGEVWIGPNAVLALAREGYSRFTLSPRDVADTLAWPGTWRMMARHWRVGAKELHRSFSKRSFLATARRHLPELRSADLQRAGAGVRAQALDRDGALLDDFAIATSGRVVWVRNAPSPAATSSLAIAEELCTRLLL